MYQNRRAWTYDVKQLGFRYHMANLHAALGLSQLRKMDRIAEVRRSACLLYNEELSKISSVTVPLTDFRDITPFLYYIRVPAEKRDALRAFLSERGIDTGIHWQPGHWFTLFKECRRGDLTVTDLVGSQILSLPLSSSITGETIRRVTAAIAQFFS